MKKNRDKIFLGLLVSGVLCFAQVSYGYGIECDASSLPHRAELGETIEFDFTCTNQSTSAEFQSYEIWPVDTNTTKLVGVDCTSEVIAPRDSCTVQATFNVATTGTHVLDFNDRFGGETHPSIFCNQPQGCVVIEIQSADNDTPLIATGQDYTNLAPPLLMSSGDQGESWQRALLPILPDEVGTLETANCMADGVCIALGNNSRDHAFPLRSIDGGNLWEHITQDPGLPLTVNASSCTGSGNTAVCVAVGQNPKDDSPLLIRSNDGGVHWTIKAFDGLPTRGEFNGVTCSGIGTTAVCVAVGENLTDRSPLLVWSNNGGTNWSMGRISGLPSSGSFYGASCTGIGVTTQCVAVGRDEESSGPLLVQTVDGGTKWGVIGITIGSSNGEFQDASCTGSGATGWCVVVGRDYADSVPLLAQSRDGGRNWNSVGIIEDLPEFGYFYSTSCTGSAATGQCVAVGRDEVSGNPLLAQSVNAGDSWSVKEITGLSTEGLFVSASCTGDAAAGQCVVVGQSLSGLPILVQGNSADPSWTWVGINIADLPAGDFLDSSCSVSGTKTQCVAVGRKAEKGGPLMVHNAGGSGWTIGAATGLSSTGIFTDSTCTGSGDQAQCVVVGKGGAPRGVNAPLLMHSLDGGVNWDAKSIPGLPVQGEFSSTSCTDDGAKARCVAVGQKQSESSGENYNIPSLVQNRDGGASWSVISINDLLYEGTFNGTSCTGRGAEAWCIAVGQDLSDSGSWHPLLVQSTNGDSNWNVVDAINLPQAGIFNSASCTGSGDMARCVAVGQHYPNTSPLLAQSVDGGDSWSVVAVTDLPEEAVFNNVSCTGSGNQSVCVALGVDLQSEAPLLVQTMDGGATWTIETVEGLSNKSLLFDVSCTGDGVETQCAVVGLDADTVTPLLAQSTNGENWRVKSVANSPQLGIFTDITCTGSGNRAQCVAQGTMDQAGGGIIPLLAQSTNGGATWSVQTISELPTLGVLGRVLTQR